MAHTVYDNFVLENKIESALTTGLDVNNYLTVDTDLTQSPGMVKTVNVYTVTGNVEDLGMGSGNSGELTVAFSGVDYTVGVTQGKFAYYDEQEMKDPTVVDAGLKGLAEKMVNDLTAKAIAAWNSASLTGSYNRTGFSFDNAVDAIALLNTEDEAGLFFMVHPEDKAGLRKSLGDDLKYSEGFARTGYIGSVAGVPVIVSKAVPTNKIFLASREAVTCFVKKGVEIEQERDADIRLNTVFARKVMLVALTDATKVVELTQATTGTP
jgi:hypothetical protein